MSARSQNGNNKTEKRMNTRASSVRGHNDANKAASGGPIQQPNMDTPTYSSVPGYTCSLCPQIVPVGDQLVCDICDGHFHPKCLNMSDTTYAALLDIIVVTGWVCPHCRTETRLQLRSLKSGLAKLAEEVAGLKEEIHHLQLSHESRSATLSSDMMSDHQVRKANNAVLATVHREMADKLRRQNNVVVRGLNPRDGTDDSDLFLQLCEDYLQSKPYVHRGKCRRLGKSSVGHPRPLLIVLDSDTSAHELIEKSRELRKHDDVKNVYINRDLTPAEALAAYELRVKRRSDRAARQGSQQTSAQPSSDTNQQAVCTAVAVPPAPAAASYSTPSTSLGTQLRV